MSAGSIGFDTTEIRAFARKFDGADKIVMNELTTAFDKSGGIILSAAKGNIHNKTNALSGSGSKKTNVSARLIITVVKFTAKHAKWVEYGRGPVVAIRAKALRFEVGGQVLFRKRVGPAKAQRFLGRAFDSNKGAVLAAVDAAAARIVARVLA
jgi:hypothetical protein